MNRNERDAWMAAALEELDAWLNEHEDLESQRDQMLDDLAYLIYEYDDDCEHEEQQLLSGIGHAGE
jgi:hypothetical protein